MYFLVLIYQGILGKTRDAIASKKADRKQKIFILVYLESNDNIFKFHKSGLTLIDNFDQSAWFPASNDVITL